MEIRFSNNKEKISEAYRQFMRLKPGMMCIPNVLITTNHDDAALRYCENIFISRSNKYMSIDYIVCCDLGGEDTYPNVLIDWETPPSKIIIQTNIANPVDIIKFVDSTKKYIERQNYAISFDFSYIDYIAKQDYWGNYINVMKYPDLHEKPFDYFDNAYEMLENYLTETNQNIENIKVAVNGLHNRVGSESPINILDGFMMERISNYVLS